MARKKEMAFVAEFETGELSLADLMAKYSEGIRLSDVCMTSLKRAEETMDLLVKDTANGITEESLQIGG